MSQAVGQPKCVFSNFQHMKSQELPQVDSLSSTFILVVGPDRPFGLPSRAGRRFRTGGGASKGIVAETCGGNVQVSPTCCACRPQAQCPSEWSTTAARIPRTSAMPGAAISVRSTSLNKISIRQRLQYPETLPKLRYLVAYLPRKSWTEPDENKREKPESSKQPQFEFSRPFFDPQALGRRLQISVMNAPHVQL